MTSKDVRDILQLGSAPSSAPIKRSGPPVPSTTKRPDGITRELYALIGDNAPSLAMQQQSSIVQPKFAQRLKKDANQAKKDKLKEKGKKVEWKQVGFTNPSRKQGKARELILRHWVKDVPKDYQDGKIDNKFEKFDTNSFVYSYTDKEYDDWLKVEGWSKEETDELFRLAHEYDLRFIVMSDRWTLTPERSVDMLKDRYYTICRILTEKRPDPPISLPVPDPNVNPEDQLRELQESLIKKKQETISSYSFDLSRELERKSYLKSLLSRTPQQIAEEDFLYVESRRLEQSYHKIVEERRELLKILGGRDGVGMNMNNAANGVNSLGGGGIKGQGVLQQQVSKKKMTGWEFEGNGNGLPEGWAGEGSKRKATAAQDAANCIERHPAPSVSAPKSNMWPSVALRSSRIAPVKSGVAQKVSIALSELGLSTQLIMPTSKNIAKLDQVQKELSLMVEVKKGLDRLLQEGRTWRKKKDILLGISTGQGSVTPAPEGGEDRQVKMEEVTGGNESIGGERQRNKRSASVASSVASTAASTKRARRE